MNRPGRNNEDRARQRNIYARKHLQSDLDAQRDMERVHLQTMRNEKIRLQKELERMRNKGQYMVKRHGISNHTQRLLKLRFTNDQSQETDIDIEGVDHEYENRARVGLPEIDQAKKNKYGKVQELQLTREERLRERRRKEAEKHQEDLVARVGKLADDFKEKQDAGGSSLISRRRSLVSPVESDAKSEGAQTSKSDSFYTVSRRGGSMPRTLRTRTSSTMSLTQAKTSVARRLLPTDSVSQRDAGDEGSVNTRKISSHVMPIADGMKKTDALPNKAKDLIFDQDMFAPDGQVRTVHLLPDPEEAFREAKKARYLRCTGPNAMDTELSVGEMFGNEEMVNQTI